MFSFTRLFVPLISLAAGVLLVAFPVGCKRSAPSGPTTVRGTVTFQGKPLAGGLVIFSPDADRGGSGKPIRGDLGPDGRYQLALGGNTAIPAGWYRVAIVALPSANAASLLEQPLFPARLARPDLSELVREVQAGQENVFDFAIEVPPG
jgi:hypothetical protein